VEWRHYHQTGELLFNRHEDQEGNEE